MFRIDREIFGKLAKAITEARLGTLYQEMALEFMLLLASSAHVARMKNERGQKAVAELASYLLSHPPKHHTGRDSEVIGDLFLQGLRAFGVEDLVTTAIAASRPREEAAATVVQNVSSTRASRREPVLTGHKHGSRSMEIADSISRQMGGKFNMGWSNRFSADLLTGRGGLFEMHDNINLMMVTEILRPGLRKLRSSLRAKSRS